MDTRGKREGVWGGWRVGSGVESTCYFCRGPRFGSQPAVNSLSEDLVPSPGLHGYQVCMWCTYMYTRAHTYT